jgi:tetrapyrrole methylase family protein/MazG family protein
MALYELDRGTGIDHLTSLFVPPLPGKGSLSAFQELVAHLRAADGCPWDLEQTHDSLRPYLLEEAYEVLQALDDGDIDSLREELGDLLLQVLLHTQIALEGDEFRMADVVAYALAKLTRRHPHVFGDVEVSGPQDVLVNWECIKGQEENHSPADGPFAGIPPSLPALARAQALLRRAARLGHEPTHAVALWARIERALKALRAATEQQDQETALGDVLFLMADLGRCLEVDAEGALRRAGRAFQQGVGHVAQESG